MLFSKEFTVEEDGIYRNRPIRNDSMGTVYSVEMVMDKHTFVEAFKKYVLEEKIGRVVLD